jgi:UDP-GlcNAc:undecaprenyl-phosphate GlcNAc-1-phosphate transferase
MNNPGALWDFVMAFTAVLVSLPVLIHLAPKFGLVDHPDGRKQQSGSVPLVGGIALFLALSVVLTTRHFYLAGIKELLAGGLLLVVIGVIGGRARVNPRYRFLVQIAAVCLMIFGAEVLLSDFGYLLGDWTLSLKWLAIPITLFCVVGVTNSINLIDGADGLSASLFLVALMGLSLAICNKGMDLSTTPEIPALAGGLCALLLFNLNLPWRGKALASFGDSGNLLMGFLLAWLFIRFSQGDSRVIAPVTALWLFAVPLLGTVFLMTNRMLKRKSMVVADRSYLHHAFLRSGWSVNGTVLVVVFIAAELAGIGLLFEFLQVSEYVSFYTFLLVSGFYYFGMSGFWKANR